MSRRRRDTDDSADTNEFDDYDITKPLDMIELPPTQHVTQLQAMRIWDRVDRLKIDLNKKIKPLKNLDWKMRIVWGLLSAMLVAAGAQTKSLITYIGDNREHEITIRYLVNQNSELNTRLRAAEETLTRSVQRIEDLNARNK